MNIRILTITTNDNNLRRLFEAKDPITIQDVKDELGYEIENMMKQYFEDNGLPESEYKLVMSAHEHHVSDGFYYVFIDELMFFKCLGFIFGQPGNALERQTQEILEKFSYAYDGQDIFECVDFDWDTYCQYCHTTIVG